MVLLSGTLSVKLMMLSPVLKLSSSLKLLVVSIQNLWDMRFRLVSGLWFDNQSSEDNFADMFTKAVGPLIFKFQFCHRLHRNSENYEEIKDS